MNDAVDVICVFTFLLTAVVVLVCMANAHDNKRAAELRAHQDQAMAVGNDKAVS